MEIVKARYFRAAPAGGAQSVSFRLIFERDVDSVSTSYSCVVKALARPLIQRFWGWIVLRSFGDELAACVKSQTVRTGRACSHLAGIATNLAIMTNVACPGSSF